MQRIKRYFPVLVLTALCGLLALYCVKVQLSNPFAWVSFRDSVSGMTLQPYYNQHNGTYYFFTPSHTTPDAVVSEMLPFGVNLRFSDDNQRYGDSLGDVPLEQDVYMSIGILRRGWSVPIQVWQNALLPSLCIEAEDGLIAYLDEEKSHAAEVSVTMIEPDGRVSLSAVAEMQGRGNGSWWGRSKRPYNLSFDNGISIGPFQDIETLCLLAEYSEESKMRNSLAYYAGYELGIPYASPYMYTNLYVNGEYRGLYGIVTKQEYKKHVESDRIKAVFEITSSIDDVDFTVDGKKYSVMHGDPQFIQQYVSDLENAFNADSSVSLPSQLDLKSFALKYTLDEFLGNMDLNHASQYFYIDQDDVIHCMLPWDYDWTIGSAIGYFNNKAENGIMAYRFGSGWFRKLIQNAAFRQEVVSILRSRFTDEFFETLSVHLQEISPMITPSRNSDLRRWQDEWPYDEYDVSSGIDTTEGFCQMFTDYFPKRRDFLLDYFSRMEDYCLVVFNGEQYGNFCIPNGQPLAPYLEGASILNGFKPRAVFNGWFTGDGKQPQGIDIVTENLYFQASFSELQ